MPTLELPPHVDEAQARLALALGLFQEELLGVGRAAEVAGLSYRAFLDELKQRGIPAYIYDDEADLEAELETIRRMQQRQEAAP